MFPMQVHQAQNYNNCSQQQHTGDKAWCKPSDYGPVKLQNKFRIEVQIQETRRK